MNRNQYIFGFLMLWVLLGGCANWTKFHNLANFVPAGTTFKKIIVHSNVKDAASQKTIEDSVVARLQGVGIDASASYQIFPPGNAIPLDSKKKTIQDSGFDAVLLVNIVSSKVTQNPVTFMKKVLVPAAPDQQPLAQSNTTISITQAPTDPSGDASQDDQLGQRNRDLPMVWQETVMNVPVAHFRIQTYLRETTDFKLVWLALTGNHEGLDEQGNIPLDKIMDSYAEAIVGEMRAEGVLAVSVDQRPVAQ